MGLFNRLHPSGKQERAEEKIIIDVYNTVKPEMRDKIFYGGQESAKEILRSICNSAFGKINEQNIRLCLDHYIQVWIRVRGGFVPENSSPSYMKEMLISRTGSAIEKETVEKLVDASLEVILKKEPELQSRVKKSEQYYNIRQYVAQQAEKNVNIENRYLDDQEYGLVPQKPVFVNGFGADQYYLSRLRTEQGASVIYKRVGSMDVDGISGPVDRYEITDPAAGVYMDIFLCNYGRNTSMKAPRGLSLNLAERE